MRYVREGWSYGESVRGIKRERDGERVREEVSEQQQWRAFE